MKLKSCPFCGSVPGIYNHMPKVRGKPLWMVGCEENFCLFSPTGHGFGSKEQAAHAWNTRSNDKHLSQLKNLLAVIHRDGGHYTEKHGLEKSQHDAIEKVCALHTDLKIELENESNIYLIYMEAASNKYIDLEEGWYCGAGKRCNEAFYRCDDKRDADDFGSRYVAEEFAKDWNLRGYPCHVHVEPGIKSAE